MHRLTRRSFLRTTGAATGALTLAGAAPVAALEGLAGSTAGAGGAGAALMLARVWAARHQRHLLGEFDDTHNVFDDGSIEVLLWPGDQARLAATGLRFEITVPDLVARDAALELEAQQQVRTVDAQPGETAGTYRTLDQFNADMRRLAEENPLIVKLLTLPHQSLQGRTVLGLEIAEDVARPDGRPVYYNDGVHHAREWPAAEVPIMWAFDLVEGYKSGDARIVTIMRHARNVIIPVVNVDGFAYSRYGPAGTGRDVFDNSLTALGNLAGASMQYWRKNMRSQIANTGEEHALPQNGVLPTQPGAFGVDPNRNYSYQWGDNIGGSSGTFNAETYRGAEPFSEPETRNVQWVFRTYQVVANITHHTSGNLVLWAWGDTHDDAPDDAVLARTGFACAAFNGYQPKKSIDLYETTGTCSDYTYGTFGSVAYTFEHAGGSFHPPYVTTVPAMYEKNAPALRLLCELVCLEPEQRGPMLAAVAGNELVTNRLTGDFAETISGTDYVYGPDTALDLTARFHCVVSGRVVDAGRNPVQATVRLTKDFRNFLWFLGNGTNPLGVSDWPEHHDSRIQTDADGRFHWVVNPSTRPYLEFLGEEEYYRLRIEDGDGRALHARSLYLSRGDVSDLGDIVVGG